MFLILYVPRSYVPQYLVPQSLCSPVVCSPIPMFPGPMSPSPYVPQSLCSPVHMFPDTYVPLYLSSPIFFLGGGEGGERSIGTICWQDLKISFLFQDGRHCHLRKFILFTFRQKEGCNITFPMTSCMRTLFLTPSFLSPTPRSWGGVSLCPSGCSTVCLSVRASIPEQIYGWTKP